MQFPDWKLPMPDLAFIHPLLVKNPLLTDALHAGVRQVATAGARLDTRLRAVLPGEHEMDALAVAWRADLRQALYGGIDDVAAFADRMRTTLPAVCAAGPYAATDAGAAKTVTCGLQVLRLAAVAHAAAVSETAAALARFEQFTHTGDRQAHAACDEAMQAVLSAQRAMGRAWHGVVCGLNALLGQAAGATLNSALLVARLDAARAGWNELAAHLRAPSSAPRTAHTVCMPSEAPETRRTPALATVSAFRHGAIGDGAGAVAELIDLLDSLATGIAHLPSPGPDSAPLVGRHIDAVRALACAWPGQLRAEVLASMATLKHFGEEFVELDAPRLQAAFDRMRGQDAAEWPQAAALVSVLGTRLAGMAHPFDTVVLGVGCYLSSMTRASLDLETDTGAVARRLKAGQSRAEALAGLANRLRLRLGAQAGRRWLPRLLAILADIAGGSPTARLIAVAHELDKVRSAQADTMKDAASLQSLLPALSSYLSAIDRLGAGVAAAQNGTASLQSQLAELHDALLASWSSGAIASAQLRAALADWRAIARRIGRLPPQGDGGATTPVGAVAPPSLRG